MELKSELILETQVTFYDDLARLFTAVSELPYARCLWIVDAAVQELYQPFIQAITEKAPGKHHLRIVPSGEQYKTLQMAEDIYQTLSDRQWTRSDAIIALGGGMVGDLSGFVAGTYLRGLPLHFVPTTLLSQVDSSIGGKVAVNMPWAKNQIGLFYPARQVHLCIDFLKTLPKTEMDSGKGELLKTLALSQSAAVLSEHWLCAFDQLDLIAAIKVALSYKIEICQRDLMDHGERFLLNFGHSLGHAIEAELGYGALPHGVAVAVGMIWIMGYFERQGRTRFGLSQELSTWLEAWDIDLPDLSQISASALIGRFGYDKKRSNTEIQLVGIEDFGKPFMVTATLESLNSLAEDLEVHYGLSH